MGYRKNDAEEETAAEAVVEEEEEKEIPPLVEPPRETSEAVKQIQQLCRVCASNGLLSISAYPSGVNLKVRTTRYRDHPEWSSVTIGEIIAQVSGTEVMFCCCCFCCEIPEEKPF